MVHQGKAMGKAVVTVCIGCEAEELGVVTARLMRGYARRIGADFVVIDTITRPDCPDVRFEKLQLRRVLDEYGQVVFFDLDCLVRPDCPDLADLAAGRFAGFNEHPYNPGMKERYEKHRDFYGYQAAWRDRYFNGGVFACTRAHRDVFTWPARFPPSDFRCREQTLMNIRLDAGGHATLDLPVAFNTMRWWEPPGWQRSSFVVHLAVMSLAERLERAHEILKRWNA